MQPQDLRESVRHAKAQRKESGKTMNRNQENSGEGRNTLPLKENRPLKELNASLGNIASAGFDCVFR